MQPDDEAELAWYRDLFCKLVTYDAETAYWANPKRMILGERLVIREVTGGKWPRQFNDDEPTITPKRVLKIG
jgi:hypothetical protein